MSTNTDAWAAYERQNQRVNPRTAGPLERSAAAGAARPTASRPVVPAVQPAQPSRHDHLLTRARDVPALARLVERHDKLIDQIAERLDAAERDDKERRQRAMEIEQQRTAAEKAREALAAAEARLRELQPTKGTGKRRQFNLSDAERERRRQQAYAMQAKLREKRAARAAQGEVRP